MRNLWKGLPAVARWSLVTLVILVSVVSAAYAYRVLTITGEVTGLESIDIVEPKTFSVALKPNETDIRIFTVTNTSSEDVEVSLDVDVSPSGQGLTAETSPDDNLTVPGNGSAQFMIILEAENDLVPQVYIVEVDIDR